MHKIKCDIEGQSCLMLHAKPFLDICQHSWKLSMISVWSDTDSIWIYTELAIATSDRKCLYELRVLKYYVENMILFTYPYHLHVGGNRFVFLTRSPLGDLIVTLTHWGRNEISISQMTFSNVFSSMKMFEFRLKFHLSLFPRVQLTIFQHWFR